MATGNHYDIIIIGTGAGGGTLAYHLAPSGKRILLLERGGYLPREKDNWDARAVFVESKYRAEETWSDRDGRPFHPGIQYYVGGNTKVYGAALLRFRPEDFGDVRHHGGISPAWPLRYEDFEPYYTQAEHLYHVHGERGIDPTEGPASAPYRYPPVSHAPRIQELFDDFRGLGHHPFPLPLGILLDEADGKALHTSACVRCPAFDGFPCLVNGKADAQVICVDPALQHANVELLTDAYVERLETNPSGHVVTNVIVTRQGAEEAFSADIVVVSCGAVNSAALLLRSGNEKHPGGLANSSGVVGRHYMRHNCSAFVAISRDPNPTVFQKTIGLNDFYFRSDDWDYPLGEIQMLGKSDGERGIRGLDGYQTEYAVDREQYVVPLPAELEPIGVLMEPLSIVEKAIDEALRVQTVRCPDAAATPDWLHGRRCLVAGLGPVGLLAAMALRLRGGEVYGLDVVDASTVRPTWLAEHEVAPRSRADLCLAGGDAPASRRCTEPATRTGSSVATATAPGRLRLTSPADAGTPTSTHDLGDELPQSSIRAQRRIG